MNENENQTQTVSTVSYLKKQDLEGNTKLHLFSIIDDDVSALFNTMKEEISKREDVKASFKNKISSLTEADVTIEKVYYPVYEIHSSYDAPFKVSNKNAVDIPNLEVYTTVTKNLNRKKLTSLTIKPYSDKTEMDVLKFDRKKSYAVDKSKSDRVIALKLPLYDKNLIIDSNEIKDRSINFVNEETGNTGTDIKYTCDMYLVPIMIVTIKGGLHKDYILKGNLANGEYTLSVEEEPMVEKASKVISRRLKFFKATWIILPLFIIGIGVYLSFFMKRNETDYFPFYVLGAGGGLFLIQLLTVFFTKHIHKPSIKELYKEKHYSKIHTLSLYPSITTWTFIYWFIDLCAIALSVLILLSRMNIISFLPF